MPRAETCIDSLTDVIQHASETARRSDDDVSLRELMRGLDHRSFGPLLLVPALIAISPIGAIPGLSIVTGTLIVLVAGQALFRDAVWLPARLLDASVATARVDGAVRRARPWVERLDPWIHPRLSPLVSSPVFEVSAVVCIGLAGTFYPLAMVPFGVFAPGMALVLFSLGWTTNDGLLVLGGLLGAAASVAATVVLWPL